MKTRKKLKKKEIISNEKLDVVKELHKPARKRFPRRRTIVKGLNDLYQADLMEFQPFARQNQGYRYILVVIDSFSKYCWTRALKSKTGKDVTNAMRTIFTVQSPKHLLTDDGLEFKNNTFKLLCNEFKVNLYSTFTNIKASMAERVIRTLKNLIYPEFSLRGKYKWIDILPEITLRYNNKIHSTIGMKPSDALKKKNEKAILRNVYTHLKVKEASRFKVGDYVRISKYKNVFAKGYTHNWSTELFKISKVKVTTPATFELIDLENNPIIGSFYKEELSIAKHKDVYLVEKVLRKKGTKVQVKYLGIAKTDWVNKKDLL